jgi:hypothetical protein
MADLSFYYKVIPVSFGFQMACETIPACFNVCIAPFSCFLLSSYFRFLSFYSPSLCVQLRQKGNHRPITPHGSTKVFVRLFGVLLHRQQRRLDALAVGFPAAR